MSEEQVKRWKCPNGCDWAWGEDENGEIFRTLEFTENGVTYKCDRCGTVLDKDKDFVVRKWHCPNGCEIDSVELCYYTLYHEYPPSTLICADYEDTELGEEDIRDDYDEYTCPKCNEVLFEGRDFREEGTPMPEWKWHCPKCGELEYVIRVYLKGVYGSLPIFNLDNDFENDPEWMSPEMVDRPYEFYCPECDTKLNIHKDYK